MSRLRDVVRPDPVWPCPTLAATQGAAGLMCFDDRSGLELLNGRRRLPSENKWPIKGEIDNQNRHAGPHADGKSPHGGCGYAVLRSMVGQGRIEGNTE